MSRNKTIYTVIVYDLKEIEKENYSNKYLNFYTKKKLLKFIRFSINMTFAICKTIFTPSTAITYNQRFIITKNKKTKFLTVAQNYLSNYLAEKEGF